MNKMNWSQLLSTRRLGVKGPAPACSKRSPFQQDFDRIVFSAPFRRLQDKTQVFPLSGSDYVRTRLTHSLETASIGRSLGTAVGDFICKNYETGLHPSDVGAIVAAAALAHDIGNPPLGHAGEEAVRHWFKHSSVLTGLREKMEAGKRADLELYEGNAQGFRILARLQNPEQDGGMQLTCATLGAFAKYPVLSSAAIRPPGVAGKKFNFFYADRDLFRRVALDTGLIELDAYSFARHPLAFLVEAADDIAYRIVDFEDGLVARRIDYREYEKLMLAAIRNPKVERELGKLSDERLKAELLRSRAVGQLVDESVQAFIDHHDELLSGTLESPLVDLIPGADPLGEIVDRSGEVIYTTPRVVEVMAAGFELFSGMLDIFVECSNDIAVNRDNAGARSKLLINLLPNYPACLSDPKWCERDNVYLRIVEVLDYLSGMSDSFAVNLYKKMKGISL